MPGLEDQPQDQAHHNHLSALLDGAEDYIPGRIRAQRDMNGVEENPERCERHQEGDHRPPEGSSSEVSPEVVHRDRDPQDQHGEPDDDELAQILRTKAQYPAELELETDELAEPLPGREEVIDKQEAEQNRPAGVQSVCRPDGDEDQCECDPSGTW